MPADVKAIVFDMDRRDAPRQTTSDKALTIAPTGLDTTTCVVKDISDTGARIALDDETSFVPKIFKLYIADKHIIAECKLVWRKGNEVGIKFHSVVDVG